MQISKQFCFCSKQVLSVSFTYKYKVLKVSPGGSSMVAMDASLNAADMAMDAVGD